MSVDEFIRCNADPIWLHQAGLYEYLMPEYNPATGTGMGFWNYATKRRLSNSMVLGQMMRPLNRKDVDQEAFEYDIPF